MYQGAPVYWTRLMSSIFHGQKYCRDGGGAAQFTRHLLHRRHE
jgi:hypothetical protein